VKKAAVPVEAESAEGRGRAGARRRDREEDASMRLVVTEKNDAAQKIADLLASGKPKADKVYNTPVYRFDVDGEDFTSAGQASVQVKKSLRQLGIAPEIIRKVSIAMYEGEINMVIHAGGGEADVLIFEDRIEIHLNDNGPGIANIDLAMQEGFSTAPDNIRSLGFGAGMGLPNMKRYSDSIKIDSALGKGTKILMTVNL
jgi:anti-sigma regulatory factor (Ser/Thr protein kinase)